MKFIFLLFTIVIASDTGEAFKQLSSLKGLWKMETGKGIIYEEWHSVNENTLSGRSYKVNQADTVVFENILLQEVDNAIYYIPTVENQNNKQRVKFKMISFANNSFSFENKDHDFPQRIIYRFVSNDSVVARIEGTKNSSEKSSEYYYKRIK